VPESAEVMGETRLDLVLAGLSKSFAGKAALTNVSLEVRAGEFIAILGPSGSGKSTLLKITAGFEQSDTGQVYLQGQDVTAVPPHRRNVNTVFQSYALFPHMSVFDNVAYGLRRKRLNEGEVRRRVADALALVALPDFGPRSPETLSGGEQQRIALARALVNRPAVLLLDEPLSALDLKIRRRMQIELKRIHEEVGTTFLYVTHDQEEALVMADRIAVMRAGSIEQVADGRAIYDRPATPFVANFIGETNWLRGHSRGVDDGTATIALESGGVARVSLGSCAGAPSGPLVLGVRPERMRMLAAGEAVGPRLTTVCATLTKVVFQGPQVMLEAVTGSGERLRALRQHSGSESNGALVPEPGAPVKLVWDESSTLLFPAADLPSSDARDDEI